MPEIGLGYRITEWIKCAQETGKGRWGGPANHINHKKLSLTNYSAGRYASAAASAKIRCGHWWRSADTRAWSTTEWWYNLFDLSGRTLGAFCTLISRIEALKNQCGSHRRTLVLFLTIGAMTILTIPTGTMGNIRNSMVIVPMFFSKRQWNLLGVRSVKRYLSLPTFQPTRPMVL